jgi:N-acetylglucosaminyldiphosphoundecaprenol N-acetyl-beta-D-mannosaminyltransferase
MKQISVLGVPLTAQAYDEAIERLTNAAASRVRLRAHFCTVHTLVEAHDDDRLRAVFESADMMAMDGMPLVWVARRSGARKAERVCGPDVLLSICDRGRETGLRHFFLGGRAGVPEQLAASLTTRYPGLDVVGTESPPFRPLSPDEDAALVAMINAANPHVLWIGLGSPKQEFWAAGHEDRLDVPLILPVGAAFDFHSGRLRRAPRWMQRSGLEWLFRLAAEPRRLLRRYVMTNGRFVFLVAREEVRRRVSRAIG